MPRIVPDKPGRKKVAAPLPLEVEYKEGVEPPVSAKQPAVRSDVPEHSGFGFDQFHGVPHDRMRKLLGSKRVTQWAMDNAAKHADKFMAQHGYTDRATAIKHLALVFIRAGLLHREQQRAGSPQAWSESLFSHPTSGKWFSVRVSPSAAKPTIAPVKLARMSANDARIATKSPAHDKRIEVARRVLSEAGLNPSIVRAAIAHDAKSSRPSAVQIIQKSASPEHTRYAAAWYGLLSGEKNLAVFHPDDNGEDFLHVISSPHPVDYIADRLRKSGVPRFVSESKGGGGSRFYIYNPLGKLDVSAVADMIPDASHSTIRGSGYRLGASASSSANASGKPAKPTEAAARANYRTVISDFERAAGA